ncbi:MULTISPECIES: restriction endonuclease [Pseudanabaena]|uniref:restriction endonuclease n=1 Tax=Pseudanabaena TaxID=1152 RepID=UPI0024799689|nr:MULTISPECIES: restriction endonuclease [Pseudanabaena]MEA5485452.1 restriction endonuclease [Pseudanabaena sp. CCNP1317]WGS73670.1 restriction endonuclease [Pseudanabaena galeata CCNP1313]
MATAAEYESIIKSLQWDGLRSLWYEIAKRDTPSWESGKAFEYLVIRAFELDGAEVRYPYKVRLFEEEIEQIDGAVHIAGFSCLVESKDFTEKKVDIAPIAKLRNQLLRRPIATVGLVFSRTGFTDPARTLSRFLSPQAILLWDGDEIEYALDNEKLCELLILKYRVCIEDGLPDYNITTRNIP